MKEEEEEIWRTYPDYPFVEANQFGEIRTKDRTVTDKNGVKYHIKGRVLKQCPNNKGYVLVHFRANGKSIYLLAHRIIATCFIPNPLGLPEVNHKDNNPKNNAASNLEWCTRKYNDAYKKNFGTTQAEVSGKPVIAINPDTSEVFWLESQHEAERQLGAHHSDVARVIKGKRNKAGGCWFCYADSTAVEKARAKFGDAVAKKVEKLLKQNKN